jgi:hypothetical protein
MRPISQVRVIALSGLILAAAACARAPSAAGEASIRALDAAYVDAWLTEEATEQERAVLALFESNAAIMPGGGSPPEIGIDNLKNFWFPDGAQPTLVTHFIHDIDDIELSGDLGVVSGRYTLSFSYQDQTVAQAGNYLIVARHRREGWRINRMIWNDQPLTEV